MKKLIIVLATLGVSFSAIFVRSSTAPSMVLVFYRVLIATSLLLPMILIKYRKELVKLNLKQLLLPVCSGVFLALHFTVYFESLKYTSIASAVVLVDTEVFFVAAALILVFKEKISGKEWIGIAATFTGSIIVTAGGLGHGTNMLIGDLLAVTGAALMAVYTMIGRQCRKTMTTMVYTFFVYAAATVTIFILVMLRGLSITGYDTKNYWIAFGLAVVCTLGGHSVYSWGLKYEKASFISTVKLLEPVFASILGLMIFAEVPTLVIIAGGIVVIFGVAYYSRNCPS